MTSECTTCDKECFPLKKNHLKSLLSEHGTIFLSLNHRPNAKFHSVIYTKRHTEDLLTITDQEWADILPVLKDGIAKIENYYKYKNKPGPLGYRINIPIGKLGGQNQPPHFYMRVVPKYKKDYGYVGSTGPYKPASQEEIKKTEALFGIQEGEKIVGETEKLVAELRNEKSFGFTKISTKKKLPPEIEAVDSETWAEIGEMLKKIVKKINSLEGSPGFQISIGLGKESQEVMQKEKEEYLGNINDYDPDFIKNLEEGRGELVISVVPRFQKKRFWLPSEGARTRKGKPIGTFENERYAEKLNNPEAYDKIWGKKLPRQEEEANSQTKTNLQNQETKDKESIWKQPTFYWGLGGGIVIALLGLGLFLLLKNDKKK